MAAMAFFQRNTFCVITGASRGLGREMAIQLSEQWRKEGAGCTLALLARSIEGLEETKAAVTKAAPGCLVHCIQADLGRLESLQDVFSEMSKHATGEIQQAVLIHNGGNTGDLTRPISEQQDAKAIQDCFATNFASVYMLTGRFISHFSQSAVKHRAVINITSLLARRHIKSTALYSCTRAAREAFMGCLLAENADLRVLNYSPGPCDTEMFHGIARESYASETRKMFEETTPLSCSQSVSKLVSVLKENTFENGTIVDYYDEYA